MAHLTAAAVGTRIAVVPRRAQRVATAHEPLHASGVDTVLQYFDPTAPRHGWPVVANWGTLGMLGISERMTLPADSGYVDSISFLFNAVTDTVHILLYRIAYIIHPPGPSIL
ncbi:MAG: hypothetical protein ACYDBH_24330 [Acidobacteriaceae bacterium]